MNIIEAIKDEKLFRPFLQDANGSISTWLPWMAALRVLYGLGKVDAMRRPLVERCTGRIYEKLPKDGFDTALFLTGRRSGKSRTAAVIGAYEAALAGTESRLAKGETGLVAICSPTKLQSRIVKNYLQAIFDTDLLRPLVVDENRDGFTLTSGVRIEIQAGSFQSIRGYTLLAAIVDEAAFFGYDEASAVKSDTELIRAIQPGLATTRGKLIAITSPYAPAGWCHSTWKRNFCNNVGRVLVWQAQSRWMNKTLPQTVIDAALEEDVAAARSEYLAEWRQPISSLVSRHVIEACVVPGRTDLLPARGVYYVAFADLSGGRHDDSALAIAHQSGPMVIIDNLLRWPAKDSNPQTVVHAMCEELKRYNVRFVTGDNYSADWVSGAFNAHGLQYVKSDKNRSQLYLELLPRLHAQEVELPDNPDLVSQLASLTRKVGGQGRDIVDHPKNSKDDLGNVIGGATTFANRRLIRIGSM